MTVGAKYGCKEGQCAVMTRRVGVGVGGGSRGKNICILIALIHAAVYEEILQHCKAIIPQLKQIFKKT